MPADFKYKGPALTLRQCRCMSGGSCSAVYDAALDCFVVSPWSFHLKPSVVSFYQMVHTPPRALRRRWYSSSVMKCGPFCSSHRSQEPPAPPRTLSRTHRALDSPPFMQTGTEPPGRGDAPDDVHFAAG